MGNIRSILAFFNHVKYCNDPLEEGSGRESRDYPTTGISWPSFNAGHVVFERAHRHQTLNSLQRFLNEDCEHIIIKIMNLGLNIRPRRLITKVPTTFDTEDAPKATELLLQLYPGEYMLSFLDNHVFLSASFYRRYYLYNEVLDLDAAIQEMQTALKSVNEGHPHFITCAFQTASLLAERYAVHKIPSDSFEAARLNKIVESRLNQEDLIVQTLWQEFQIYLSSSTQSCADIPLPTCRRFHGRLISWEAALFLKTLETLGFSYFASFFMNRDFEDFNQARRYLPSASALLASNYPFDIHRYRQMVEFQFYLAWESGFKEIESIKLLGVKCLQKMQGKIFSIPPSLFSFISKTYGSRYQSFGYSEDDLEYSLVYSRWAARDEFCNDPDHYLHLHMCATISRQRFEASDDPYDLTNAITYGRKSICPQIQANFSLEAYAMQCHELTACHLHRFALSERRGDLQEAFEYHLTVLYLTKELGPRITFRESIDTTTAGLMKIAANRNFSGGIEFGEIFISEFIFPKDVHSDILGSLGTLYAIHYLKHPKNADPDLLELGIERITWTSDREFFRSNLLPLLHAARNEMYNDTTDLNAAIDGLRRIYAIDAADRVDKIHPLIEFHLGLNLQRRYHHSGNEEDLRASLLHLESGLGSLTGSSSPQFSGSSDLRIDMQILMAMAYLALSRKCPDDAVYIDTGLKIMHDCLVCHNPTMEKTQLLSIQINLAVLHMQRFLQAMKKEDLRQVSVFISEASELYDELSKVKPEFEHDYSLALAFLRNTQLHHAMFTCTSSTRDDESLYGLQSCLTSAKKVAAIPGYSHSNALWKVQSADLWGGLALLINSSECLEAYETYSSLLSAVLWIGDGVEDKHHTLRSVRVPVVAARATFAALKHGTVQLAVEYYEQGLSITYRQLLHLRNHTLVGLEPGLAKRYEEVSTAILNRMKNPKVTTQSPRIAQKYYQTLKDIRSQRGFEKVFVRETYGSLASASQYGPVILLNRCSDWFGFSRMGEDAIILLSPDKDPIRLALSSDSPLRAEMIVSRLQKVLYRCGVASSWRRLLASSKRAGGIVRVESMEEDNAREFEEILQDLQEYVVNPVSEVLSKNGIKSGRIWWCPSGIFTRLPLHAAVPLDYPYIQSYVYSLESLIHARKRLHESEPVSEVRMTAVGINKYPDPRLSELPCVPTELDTLIDITQDKPLNLAVLRNEDATVDGVLDRLKASHVMHIACHGIRDPTDPLKDGVCLYDGTLALKRVLAEEFYAKFIFLSACETARGNLALANESAHPTGGFMAAGFKGGIGTLWNILDFYAPDVAKGVYEAILTKQGLDITRAAEGLQTAVRRLREADVPYQYWMPYIHVGV